MSERTVPLAKPTVPLAKPTVPMAEPQVPMAEPQVPSADRDMMHNPLPTVDSKYLPLVNKLDATIAKTFQSIRQLHSVIKSRCTGEEISAETLVKLMTASWAVENSQDAGRQFIVHRNKHDYKIFMHTMYGITSHVENLIQRCMQHPIIPFKLTAEVLLFGGNIKALMQKYIQ